MAKSDDGDIYRAALAYYLQGSTQEAIARTLGVSRASVSRMLSEARARGIVTITVKRPTAIELLELEREVALAIGINSVYLVKSSGGVDSLTPALARALSSLEMRPGETLLVASGRSIYEAVQGADLPSLEGVVIAPTIGGQNEPAPWYQTNEIVRIVASKTDGYPTFLFAPAVPSPDVFRHLSQEPSIERIYRLWDSARAAVVGIGMAPMKRDELPLFIAGDVLSLGKAVGDVASRYIDGDGAEVRFDGHERYVAISLEQLRRVPDKIGVGVGGKRVEPILIAASAGLITSLVTDTETAIKLMDAQS